MTHRPTTPKSVKPVLGMRDIRACAVKGLEHERVSLNFNDQVGVPINRAKGIVGVPLNDLVGVPISKAAAMASGESITSLHDVGTFNILGKKDIEKELARTKELFHMTPDEFYEAWKRDEVHGFHATKLGCLYEFYRDEFE